MKSIAIMITAAIALLPGYATAMSGHRAEEYRGGQSAGEHHKGQSAYGSGDTPGLLTSAAKTKVPEPGSLTLMALGLGGLVVTRYLKKRRA